MQRNTACYALAGSQANDIKKRMLNWANQFSILLFLDNNDFRSPYGRYECLLGAGNAAIDPVTAQDDWRFGHICYDYKNTIEPKLVPGHTPKNGFPDLSFFIPFTVCHINSEQSIFTIETFGDPAAVYEEIMSCKSETEQTGIPGIKFATVIDKDSYLQTIERLRGHIAAGDCYEINFCNEGYCDDVTVAPLHVFCALNQLSPAPFAAFYKMGDSFMMCASPERYLQRNGGKILSQPMKGTARREQDPVKDEAVKNSMRNSMKEQAENVMITDLVRNDLARCCQPGSVQVDELFGVYSFPTVHQMVSTVSGTLQAGLSFEDIILCTFPMGSMTGAPKYKVMQLIEEYELSARELFSGTVGYIKPDGDFDFNVVIRSLFYNARTRRLSYQTGGAITYDSVAAQEWDETRLKAWAMERIFSEPTG